MKIDHILHTAIDTTMIVLNFIQQYANTLTALATIGIMIYTRGIVINSGTIHKDLDSIKSKLYKSVSAIESRLLLLPSGALNHNGMQVQNNDQEIIMLSAFIDEVKVAYQYSDAPNRDAIKTVLVSFLARNATTFNMDADYIIHYNYPALNDKINSFLLSIGVQHHHDYDHNHLK